MSNDFSVHHQTLESFFFEEIEHVQERTGKSLPHEVEAYVVHLLATYARRTHDAGRASRPLAMDYLQAKHATGSARALALRGVGDRALYISGVVPRSLERSPVSIRYVQGIGEAAYREVADQGGYGSALAVLGELAAMFGEVAEVIGDVVEVGHGEENNLLGLYERWRRDRDPRDAKRLIRAGVILGEDGSDTVQ